MTIPDARRRYVTLMTRRRLHQQTFRQRVLQAYREHCAICRLRHEELLDAAHSPGHASVRRTDRAERPRALPTPPCGIRLSHHRDQAGLRRRGSARHPGRGGWAHAPARTTRSARRQDPGAERVWPAAETGVPGRALFTVPKGRRANPPAALQFPLGRPNWSSVGFAQFELNAGIAVIVLPTRKS